MLQFSFWSFYYRFTLSFTTVCKILWSVKCGLSTSGMWWIGTMCEWAVSNYRSTTTTIYFNVKCV